MYRGKSKNKLLLPGQRDYSNLKSAIGYFLALVGMFAFWYVSMVFLYGIMG